MNKEDEELDAVGRKLVAAFPPVDDLELKVDLWPRMLRRLEDSPARFGFPEALIAGLLVLVLVIFPELIPMMLYNL